MNPTELNTLIEGCKRNNRVSQRELYDAFSGLLFTICLRYSKNEAEDLLQMSFIKIFNNVKQYQGAGSFEGWIKRITVNTAITHYHKKNILSKSEDITDYKEEVSSDVESSLEKMSKNDLIEVINSLPDIYKISFNLYAIEGYKHNEIADMLGISEGTSKSQLSRARKMIQQKLKQTELMEEARTI